jgi:hypothetical protein
MSGAPILHCLCSGCLIVCRAMHQTESGGRGGGGGLGMLLWLVGRGVSGSSIPPLLFIPAPTSSRLMTDANRRQLSKTLGPSGGMSTLCGGFVSLAEFNGVGDEEGGALSCDLVPLRTRFSRPCNSAEAVKVIGSLTSLSWRPDERKKTSTCAEWLAPTRSLAKA